MTIIHRLALGLGAVALSFAALAQDDEPKMYTYATYMYCDIDGQDRADEIVASRDAPVLNKLVEDGVIEAWGWLVHHTGGKWRRLRYHQATSLDDLLDGLDAIGEAMSEASDDETDAEFADICDSHVDYIWQFMNGSAGKDRGAAGFSVYHVCDVAKEERADEIVAEHFAPILDKMVEDGKLTSWGWSSHVVGGKYRKLQTMTAADHKSLLKARGEAISAIYDEDNEAGEEFTNICGPHSDYMWDIVHEARR